MKFLFQAQSSTGVSATHRLLRRPASVAGLSHHRRTKSMVHHHDHDNSEVVTLEEELAKQTRKVQNLKAQGTSSEEFQIEKDKLKWLQDDLAYAMRHTLRGPNRGMSRWFTQLPHATGEGGNSGGGSMGRRISQVVRKQLFNQGQYVVLKKFF